MRKRLLSILLLCCMVLTLLPTAAVAKADYTGAAAIAAVTDNAHRWDTKIEITNVTPGQEYAITTGNTAPTEGWQDGGVFTGLKKNTAYTVYTRVKATPTMAASDSVTTSVKTKNAMYPLVFDLSGLTSTYHYNGSAQDPSVDYASGYSAATVGGFTFKYEKNVSGYPPVSECKLPGAYGVTIVTDNTGSDYASGESYVGVFSISRGNLTAADFQVTGLTTYDYDGSPKKATVTLKSGMEGVGTITVYYEGVAPTVYIRQTTAPTNAGSYKVSVDVATGDYYNSVNNLELGTLTINKVNYTTTTTFTETVRSGQATNNKTLTLPALPAGASYDTITVGGTTAALIDGTPTVSGNTLTYSTTSQANNASATITIPVTGATNYNNYNIVVTVTAKDKENAGVSITTPPTSKTYGDANFTLTATKTAPDGGTWSWNSSDPAILEIVSGADTATPTIKVKKADATGATLTVTYTSSTHYGSANVIITVAQKEVTVSGITAADKVYDGGTSATVNASGATFAGIVSGDTLTITSTGTFADANVGNGKTVNLTLGILGGASAANYKLAATGHQTETTANITAATLTVQPATLLSKVFGEADPPLTYTYTGNFETPAFDGKLERDPGENAGIYEIKQGTLKLKDNAPFLANNYKLVVTSGSKFVITKAATPAAPTGLTGVKDQPLSTVSLAAYPGWSWANPAQSMSATGSQTFTANYTDPAGNHLSGTGISVVVNVSAKTDAGVTISSVPAGKTYGDANFTLTAVKSSADTGGTWSWASSDDTILKIVSGGNTATATVQVLKADATGATLTVTYTSSTHYGSANVIISVAQKEVTVSGITAADKVYDGNNSATVNASTATITGKETGDDLTVSVAAGSTFDSADAGSRTVTLGALTLGGASAANYTLAAAGNQTTTTANITAATLTVTPTSAQSKKYGESDPATLNYAYSSAVASETPAFDGALSRDPGEDVGTYNITKGSLELKDSGTFKATNYNLVLDTAVVTFEIAKGTYGGSTPTKTVNILKNYAGVQTGTLKAADFFTTAPAEAKITNAVPNFASSSMMSTAGADASGNFTYASKMNITAASNENWTITISSKNYTDIFATLTFSPVDKTDVSAQITFPNGTLTYNGAGQKYEKATISGASGGTWTYTYTAATGTTASLDSTGLPLTAGTYTVTAKYEDSANLGTKNATLTISKATPTGTPNYTKITTSGKTLANANLTVGTITPAGTISWDAGDTQSVAANTAYNWTFNPTDTVNYNNLTGSITPYTVSHSGGGGGGSYTPSYSITVDKTENGTITVSPKSASKGDTVTITVKPDKGYELDTLKVLDKDGDKVKITEKKGKYTFTMPASKVTVKGKFVEEAPEQIFADVPVDAYCYEAVKWAASEGITGGIGNNLFAPGRPCTRGQIVTFLWRAAGSPAPKSMSSFADVAEDAYYAKAVAWAVENGITGGTGDGKFSPDATCTRAQAVTFLYRASGSPAVSGSAEFGDVATNAYYADAVAWAAKNGITGGIGGGLFGSDNNCTRGQIVTFLYRAYNK